MSEYIDTELMSTDDLYKWLQQCHKVRFYLEKLESEGQALNWVGYTEIAKLEAMIKWLITVINSRDISDTL